MSASPNTALLSLPPLRPSPHKQPSFARSGSSSAVPKATTTRRARSSSIVSVQEVADTYDDQLDQAAFTNINAEWVNYKGQSPSPLSSRSLSSSPRAWFASVEPSMAALRIAVSGWDAPACTRASPPPVSTWTDLFPAHPPALSLRDDPLSSNVGAWLIHVVLIASAILLLETIPGMSQDLTWTIVNLGYLSVRSRVSALPRPGDELADLQRLPPYQVSYVIFHYVTGVPFDMTNNSGAFDNLTLWEQIDSGAQYTPAKKWLTSVPIFLCA